MSDIEKVYDHILDQFSDVPNWQSYYTIIAELTDGHREALLTWHSRRYLETAEGAELDVCGARIGLPRPYGWLETGVFTWDSNVPGERWDEGLWSGTNGVSTGVLLDDEDYRYLLRAKAYANGSGSSLYDIATTIDLMFTLDYTVETSEERVVSITFNEFVSSFQRYHIRALAPVQMDTDLVFTN